MEIEIRNRRYSVPFIMNKYTAITCNKKAPHIAGLDVVVMFYE